MGSPRNALLLALNGGLEIAAAVEEILTSQPFDMEKAHRLGDAVSGRDNEPRLDLLNAYLLDRIVQGALHAGEAGAIEQAARLAELWQRTNEAMRTADTYHLDRKQLIVSTLLEIRAALPSAG
jgi:DNA polymerase-3 subunit delta'